MWVMTSEDNEIAISDILGGFQTRINGILYEIGWKLSGRLKYRSKFTTCLQVTNHSNYIYINRIRGKGKCRKTNNTKIGIKRGNSYQDNEVSGWKV